MRPKTSLKMLALETDKDHLHCFVSALPKLSLLPKIVSYLKGYPSQIRRKVTLTIKSVKNELVVENIENRLSNKGSKHRHSSSFWMNLSKLRSELNKAF